MSVQSIHPEEEQRLTHTLQEIDRQLGGIGPRYLGVEQRLFKQTIIANKEPSYKKFDWRRVNKEKTSDESHTHGEMVRGLFHTRCQVRIRNHKGLKRIYIDFDTEARRFASLISAYRPKHLSSLHDHVAGLFKHRFSQFPINLMNCISHDYRWRKL